MSDIRLVKLKSGEEIIGDVTVISDDVIIANPCQLIPTQQGISFVPWPPFSKHESVSIKLDWTICITDPVDEARDAWNSKFGSGIILPNVQLNG
jgi:hypothetical protein